MDEEQARTSLARTLREAVRHAELFDPIISPATTSHSPLVDNVIERPIVVATGTARTVLRTLVA